MASNIWRRRSEMVEIIFELLGRLRIPPQVALALLVLIVLFAGGVLLFYV